MRSGLGFLMVLAGCSVAAVPCPTVDAGTVTESFDASVPAGAKVLWVGAHPDDEALAAPILGEWCRRAGASCTFLVLTRGEAGTCAKDYGCLPDLGTVRTLEMQGSATYFGATLVQQNLPDTRATLTTGQVQEAWTLFEGSQAALVEVVASVLRRTPFDVVITFDPRHGSTCHPAHRITGALTLSAVDAVGLPRSSVLLLGSTFAQTQDGSGRPCQLGLIPVVQSDLLKAVDASGAGRQARWTDFVTTLGKHPSQFTQPMIDAASAAPAGWRALELLRASDASDSDPAWLNLCTE